MGWRPLHWAGCIGQDLVLACLMIWELILCFITLEQTDVIDTGLKKRG